PPRAPGAPVRAEGTAQVRAELGGDHHVVAAAAERPTEQLLRVPVGVGRVEQRDAGVERGLDDGPGALPVEVGAEVVAAEPDRGHREPGAAEAADRVPAHDTVVVSARCSRRSRLRTLPAGLRGSGSGRTSTTDGTLNAAMRSPAKRRSSSTSRVAPA